MYAKIALFGLARKKGRTLFTVLAIAVAVSMAILLISVGVGLKQGTSMMYEKDVHYWVVPKDSGVTDLVSSSERTMLGEVHQNVEKIKSYPDIKGATPVLNRPIYASSSGRSPRMILGVGIIPGSSDDFTASSQYFAKGDPYFSGGIMSGEVVINDRTAMILGVKKGDSLLIGTVSSGLNNSFMVMEVISSAEYSVSPIAVLHLSELQELTGNLKGDRANYIIARGSNAIPFLNELFPDAVVLSSTDYSAYRIFSDKKILATSVAVSAVSMLIAVLFICSAMIMSINEKQQEFAVMRAIGISQSSITKMVLYESLILSMLGAGIGILLSGLGQKILNTASYRFFEAGQVAVIDPIMLLAGIGIAIGAGIISGLIPAVIASRIDIAETLG